MKKLVALFALFTLAACGGATVDAAGSPTGAPANAVEQKDGCCDAKAEGSCGACCVEPATAKKPTDTKQ